jgi:hypothetical protein
MSHIRSKLFSYLIALLFGVFAGYVDLHNDEVQACVLVLLVGTVLLGAWQPKHPWRWALIIGGCVPAAHIIGTLTGHHPPYKTDLAGPFLALIPALIGAYGGAVIRLAFSHPATEP